MLMTNQKIENKLFLYCYFWYSDQSCYIMIQIYLVEDETIPERAHINLYEAIENFMSWYRLKIAPYDIVSIPLEVGILQDKSFP